mmetsp:Transcript_93504/g.248198  ORF Transcript_93504/g.248198 Transcript_93504/m.248198 type:complete len:228 (-) Transcript_93504:347-1030(-)
MPPKGRSSWRTPRAISSNASNSPPSSIEISSITSALTSSQLRDFLLLRRTSRSSCSGGPSPSPTPAQLCTVVPPMFTAAMPVDAQTATSLAPVCLERRAAMARRSRKLLPVPAEPVKNTEAPPQIHSNTALCSADNGTSGSTGRAEHGSSAPSPKPSGKPSARSRRRFWGLGAAPGAPGGPAPLDEATTSAPPPVECPSSPRAARLPPPAPKPPPPPPLPLMCSHHG